MSQSSPRRKPKTGGGLGASATPGPGVRLSELIERYLAASGGYGKAAALSALGLSHAETEAAFSQFDEDYMISRFFHFTKSSGAEFRIDGFPQTHVMIDAEIQSIL